MGASGDENVTLINAEGKETAIDRGKVSKEVKDAANGKGSGSYLKSTIRIPTYNYSSKFDIASLVNTILMNHNILLSLFVQ